MRLQVVRRHASATLTAIVLASTMLSGCNWLSPAADTSTMSLLRTGSEKVCVAPDVQAALKSMILLKPEDVSGEGTVEEKLAAIKTVSLIYELTTLQAFDKAVAKARCNTQIKLTNNIDNKPEKLQLTFEVTPAADNPSTFIIAIANSNEAQAYVRMMIAAAMSKASGERAEQQEAAQRAQAEAQIRAVVSERWLRGVWIAPDAQASTCATSDAVRFEDGHVLRGALGNGRWSLSGTQLHIIATSQGQASDDTYILQAADAVSFSAGLRDTDAGNISLRRCTGDELHATPEPDGSVQVISDQEAH